MESVLAMCNREVIDHHKTCSDYFWLLNRYANMVIVTHGRTNQFKRVWDRVYFVQTRRFLDIHSCVAGLVFFWTLMCCAIVFVVVVVVVVVFVVVVV